MAITMIMKKEAEAVVINGTKYIVYKGKHYKPVERFFNSSTAIQYARDNRHSLIISIIDKKASRWLVMEEVV